MCTPVSGRPACACRLNDTFSLVTQMHFRVPDKFEESEGEDTVLRDEMGNPIPCVSQAAGRHDMVWCARRLKYPY